MIIAKKVIIFVTGKAKTLEVCETSRVFCSVYVRWLMPLGCYCLPFLSNHLQMK